MITLQHRQLVGHDILLARHGSRICSMRVDRGGGRVVALLSDGSVDSAPNLIAPGLRLPDSSQGVLREDSKFFTAVLGIAVILGGMVFATLAALAGAVGGNPEMVEMLTAYSVHGY